MRAMPIVDILDHLARLSTAPTEKEAFEEWLRFDNAVAFLEENAGDEDFVVYAGLPHTFMLRWSFLRLLPLRRTLTT